MYLEGVGAKIQRTFNLACREAGAIKVNPAHIQSLSDSLHARCTEAWTTNVQISQPLSYLP